jgi:tRNA(Arg) A34 adenosine deaminase TadA
MREWDKHEVGCRNLQKGYLKWNPIHLALCLRIDNLKERVTVKLMTESPNPFMQEAITMSRHSIQAGLGGPFGAVVVKDGKIIAKAHNQVTSSNDPTAHAEVVAIREACKALKTFQLTGCEIYTSCEPCPMCMGAIYWARPDRVYYGNTKVDAAKIGFDDQFIYEELEIPIADRKLSMTQLMQKEALEVFQEWEEKTDKVEY